MRFGRIVNGVVVEILVADELPPFVPEIAEQFREVAENVQQNWVASGNSFVAPPAPVISPQDQANQLLLGGLQIVSTGTPSLNGTYALDVDSQNILGGISGRLANNLGFPPGNSATLDYGDIAGGVHTFDATSFKHLLVACGDFIYHVNMTLKTKMLGGDAEWPAQPVTIA